MWAASGSSTIGDSVPSKSSATTAEAAARTSAAYRRSPSGEVNSMGPSQPRTRAAGRAAQRGSGQAASAVRTTVRRSARIGSTAGARRSIAEVEGQHLRRGLEPLGK